MPDEQCRQVRRLPRRQLPDKWVQGLQSPWPIRKVPMSEEKQQQGITPEAITKVIERLGLPTILIIAIGYVGYNEIVSPIAAKYAEMLDAVTDSNTKLTEIVDDVRLKLTETARKNGELIEKLGEDAADAKAMQRELAAKIDTLLAATRELSSRIGSLPPPIRCSPSRLE